MKYTASFPLTITTLLVFIIMFLIGFTEGGSVLTDGGSLCGGVPNDDAAKSVIHFDPKANTFTWGVALRTRCHISGSYSRLSDGRVQFTVTSETCADSQVLVSMQEGSSTSSSSLSLTARDEWRQTGTSTFSHCSPVDLRGCPKTCKACADNDDTASKHGESLMFEAGNKFTFEMTTEAGDECVASGLYVKKENVHVEGSTHFDTVVTRASASCPADAAHIEYFTQQKSVSCAFNARTPTMTEFKGTQCPGAAPSTEKTSLNEGSTLSTGVVILIVVAVLGMSALGLAAVFLLRGEKKNPTRTTNGNLTEHDDGEHTNSTLIVAEKEEALLSNTNCIV